MMALVVEYGERTPPYLDGIEKDVQAFVEKKKAPPSWRGLHEGRN
jgi:hypothetical protein